MEFEVIFYETENGQKPVEDFLLSLNTKMRTKMVQMMEILEDKGFALREPYTKPLGDGIFELRCKLASDISRALFFFYIGQKIIVTNGFIKKTMKTPQKEIRLAQERRADYIRRMEEAMKTLKEFKAEQMKDPDFASAYMELEPEMNIIRAIVDARINQHLTQKELAAKAGIAQTEISRIENGTRNPSLKILQRLAEGMGMVLKISFEPKKKLSV